MDKVFWITLALLAGSLIPLQGAFNARLGEAVASPIHASMISFVIGTVSIAAYAFATRQAVFWPGLLSAPWYGWLGGLCGAFSLTAIILIYPKLGPGVGFRSVSGGATDRFCLFGTLQHPGRATPSNKLAKNSGIALVLGGVVLIRTF